MYGVKENNLKWFHSYLSNRKQYTEFQNDDKKKTTNSLTIKCGSILGSLLFIVYVNDLYRASNILKPIMFANDTNLFCSAKLFFKQQTLNWKKYQFGFKQTNFP